MKKNKNAKGFTLIELLVVIAIIAILSVVVILTLNPAELLKQARDATRISDLSTLRTAISAYLADVNTPLLAGPSSVYTSCYEGSLTSSAGTKCGFDASYSAIVSTTSRSVDGTGWLPVNFNSISSGAPIGTLPVDPLNTGSNVYRYAASTTLVFEIDADLESTKQTNATGAEQTDGGSSSTIYEIGNAPSLAL